MSTDYIFGGWDTHPVTGEYDHLSSLWHLLASQKQGTADFTPNFGLSQRRHEITPLWALFERSKPKVIVEVGVAQGGTLASWCMLAPDDATIIAIDRDLNDCRPRPGDPVHPAIWNGELKMSDQGGGFHCLKKANQKILGISGWSFDDITVARLKHYLQGRKIDFLFHDASHEASMFAKDWKVYWPLIAEGGIFASHDISPSSDPKCNKNVEWERIKREEQYSAVFEFKSHPSVTEMGVGVIIK